MATYVGEHAAIDSRAEIDMDVEIGPYCVIGPHARIGRGTRLENGVTVMGHVTIGEQNHIYPGVVIGGEPQDLSYRGSETRVVIGDYNTIREGVTINRATEKEDGVTSLGNHNYLMACSHVAHDCRLGSHIIIANGTLLGGHVHIHDHASLSGGVAVHHYATIGGYSFVAGLSRVLHDVPPFMLVDGHPTRPRCINVVALKRNDFTPETIDCLAEAHRLLYRAKVGLDHAREILRGNSQMLPHVNELLSFVQTQQEGKHGRGARAEEGGVKPLKVAVIGAGHLGRIHARLLSGMPAFTLVGVADPDEAARHQVAASYQTQAFSGHRPLLGEIDAAIVATPTRFHHEVALELLQHGVHLLVEKPLTATLAEADELVNAAQSHGAVLQVGHVERFNPGLAAALPHIHEPKYIEAVRQGGFAFRSTDIGVVLDLMIHDIDVVLALVRSRVRSVEALGISVFGGHEDLANARVTFENGCVATFSASRASRTAVRTMHVWSQRCFASIDFAARTADLVRPSETLLRRELDIDHLLPEEKARLKETLLAEHLPLEQIQAEPCDAITAELTDFADSIRSGRAPRVSGEQGRDAVGVAEQVLASIDAHGWDGTIDGRFGSLALPGLRPQRAIPAQPDTHILRGPHWLAQPLPPPHEQREAG